MSFWQQLVQERELRGVSLEEIAESTKISIDTLRRMEAGNPKHLPARVYLVGYLRAYAETVGLDAEDIVLRYEEEILREQDEPGKEEETQSESNAGRKRPLMYAAIICASIIVIGAVLKIIF